MLLLKHQLNLSALWQEVLVSSTVGAAAISALVGGSLNGIMGRRKCILLASFIFSVGGFVLSLAPNKEVLLLGRITVGLGIGNSWYMLGLSVVPALLQFFGFLFLPESPRWLLQKDRSSEALTVLQTIRGAADVEEEFESIRSSIQEEQRASGAGGTTAPPSCRCREFETFRRPSGCRRDFGHNFLFTLVGVWLVERVGRRSLTVASLVGMGPMPWTVNSEIFPLWARSTGNACSAGVNWTFNVLVSLTFLHVAQYLTYYGAFFLYAGLVVLGLVFVLVFLPETRGLQLEDIEGLFSSGFWFCSSGSSRAEVQYTRVNGTDQDRDQSDREPDSDSDEDQD
ncbi:hypothetical protein WMY93_026946 [Mugilogobius chulae]|uniref:Major facilitator superfamily (MFS) profile domain-containing protein n=1 Tax=Mugilogobius chulae TaxID=88201 RepID=A0AAW0MRJ1_9GOBI